MRAVAYRGNFKKDYNNMLNMHTNLYSTNQTHREIENQPKKKTINTPDNTTLQVCLSKIVFVPPVYTAQELELVANAEGGFTIQPS